MLIKSLCIVGRTIVYYRCTIYISLLHEILCVHILILYNALRLESSYINVQNFSTTCAHFSITKTQFSMYIICKIIIYIIIYNVIHLNIYTHYFETF